MQQPFTNQFSGQRKYGKRCVRVGRQFLGDQFGNRTTHRQPLRGHEIRVCPNLIDVYEFKLDVYGLKLDVYGLKI